MDSYANQFIKFYEIPLKMSRNSHITIPLVEYLCTEQSPRGKDLKEFDYVFFGYSIL